MSQSIKVRTRAETQFTSLLPSHEAVTLFQFLMITLYLLKCTAATYAIRQWRPCFSLCALWTSNVPLLVLRWEPIILPFVRTKSCEQALSGSLSTCFWLSMALSFWPHLAFFWLSFSLAHSGSIHGSLPPSLSLSLSGFLGPCSVCCAAALYPPLPPPLSPPPGPLWPHWWLTFEIGFNDIWRLFASNLFPKLFSGKISNCSKNHFDKRRRDLNKSERTKHQS